MIYDWQGVFECKLVDDHEAELVFWKNQGVRKFWMPEILKYKLPIIKKKIVHLYFLSSSVRLYGSPIQFTYTKQRIFTARSTHELMKLNNVHTLEACVTVEIHNKE